MMNIQKIMEIVGHIVFIGVFVYEDNQEASQSSQKLGIDSQLL